MKINILGEKLKFTKEFTDEDGIECMIFKYKESVLSPGQRIALTMSEGVNVDGESLKIEI